MKNILLIGGEGYIGNIVTHSLLRKGYSVTSYDNLIYNNQQCVLNKIHLDNCIFEYGDMLDDQGMESLTQKTNCVILLAGLVGDPITKKYLEFESEFPEDLKNLLDLLVKY